MRPCLTCVESVLLAPLHFDEDADPFKRGAASSDLARKLEGEAGCVPASPPDHGIGLNANRDWRYGGNLTGPDGARPQVLPRFVAERDPRIALDERAVVGKAVAVQAERLTEHIEFRRRGVAGGAQCSIAGECRDAVRACDRRIGVRNAAAYRM
jgi:hypothetical protein